MKEAMSQEKVIHVLAIGMDGRKLAIIRMAFKMYAVQHYRLLEDAPGASPDVAIVDMDCVGAQALWEEFRARYPNLPAVIATVSPPEDAPAPVLTKPIRMDALFPLLRKTILTGGLSPASPVKPLAQPKPQAASGDAAPPVIPVPQPPALQPEEPMAHSAPVSDAPATARAALQIKANLHVFPASVERFDPRQGLFSVLGDIRRKRIPSVVSLEGQDLIIALPSQDKALLLQDLLAIQRACDPSAGAITMRQLAPTDTPSRAVPQNLTALLWQAAIWTSRGRLMEGITPETPIRLRHWPNLTRLSSVPESMRIAAFWVRNPVNLRLTVKMLNIAPPHVFDFLAASYAIGILDIPESGGAQVATPILSAPAPTAEQKARGGFLSRLLRKVVGL